MKLDDGFPHHPKVVGLSLEARWAYVEALCYAGRYQTDGEVPDAVAAKGSQRAELIAAGLWESLENSISIHDYLVYNISREDALALSKERAQAGARGGARAQASAKHVLLKDGSSTGLEVSEGGSGGEPFAAFWTEYPRKVGRRKAQPAFASALRRAPAEQIIEGARRYREDANREDAYTAHPTTWLNRDGWDDDSLPSKQEAPKDPYRNLPDFTGRRSS